MLTQKHTVVIILKAAGNDKEKMKMRNLLGLFFFVVLSGCLSQPETERPQGDYKVTRGTIEEIRYVPDHHDPLWVHTEVVFRNGNVFNLRGISGILAQGIPVGIYHGEEYGGGPRRIYKGMKMLGADSTAISYDRDGFVYVSGVIENAEEYPHKVCSTYPGANTHFDTFLILHYRSGIRVAIFGRKNGVVGNKLTLGRRSTMKVRHNYDGKGWPCYFSAIEYL